jgi:hypothetical protein
VSGTGSLEEWRCTKCGQELTVINRDLSRLGMFGDVRPASRTAISPMRSRLTPGPGTPSATVS